MAEISPNFTPIPLSPSLRTTGIFPEIGQERKRAAWSMRPHIIHGDGELFAWNITLQNVKGPSKRVGPFEAGSGAPPPPISTLMLLLLLTP